MQLDRKQSFLLYLERKGSELPVTGGMGDEANLALSGGELPLLAKYDSQLIGIDTCNRVKKSAFII